MYQSRWHCRMFLSDHVAIQIHTNKALATERVFENSLLKIEHGKLCRSFFLVLSLILETTQCPFI